MCVQLATEKSRMELSDLGSDEKQSASNNHSMIYKYPTQWLALLLIYICRKVIEPPTFEPMKHHAITTWRVWPLAGSGGRLTRTRHSGRMSKTGSSYRAFCWPTTHQVINNSRHAWLKLPRQKGGMCSRGSRRYIYLSFLLAIYIYYMQYVSVICIYAVMCTSIQWRRCSAVKPVDFSNVIVY